MHQEMPGIELEAFRSRVRRSTNSAIPTTEGFNQEPTHKSEEFVQNSGPGFGSLVA